MKARAIESSEEQKDDSRGGLENVIGGECQARHAQGFSLLTLEMTSQAERDIADSLGGKVHSSLHLACSEATFASFSLWCLRSDLWPAPSSRLPHSYTRKATLPVG